ncbi:MAG: hypothetical protein ACK4TN_00810, partial [Brevinematales bacterium]
MEKKLYIMSVIFFVFLGLVSCSLKAEILSAFGFSSSEGGDYAGEGGGGISSLPLLEGVSLYVSTNGDDTFTGLSPSQALRSLSKAMMMASTNLSVSNILITEGGYIENETLFLTNRGGLHIVGGLSDDFKAIKSYSYVSAPLLDSLWIVSNAQSISIYNVFLFHNTNAISLYQVTNMVLSNIIGRSNAVSSIFLTHSSHVAIKDSY